MLHDEEYVCSVAEHYCQPGYARLPVSWSRDDSCIVLPHYSAEGSQPELAATVHVGLTLWRTCDDELKQPTRITLTSVLKPGASRWGANWPMVADSDSSRAKATSITPSVMGIVGEFASRNADRCLTMNWRVVSLESLQQPLPLCIIGIVHNNHSFFIR